MKIIKFNNLKFSHWQASPLYFRKSLTWFGKKAFGITWGDGKIYFWNS